MRGRIALITGDIATKVDAEAERDRGVVIGVVNLECKQPRAYHLVKVQSAGMIRQEMSHSPRRQCLTAGGNQYGRAGP